MKAITVDELEAGMILARTVTNSDFVVILSENTALTDANISRLKSLEIPVVYIKDEFDLSQNFQQAASTIQKDAAFKHDFKKVAKIANKVFEELRAGNEIKAEVTRLAAHVLPMADNPASVNYLFALSHMSTTLALHSERVSIFSGIIAKWMKFNWEEIRIIVTAAFLHDVGKCEIPEELIGKTAEELSGDDLEIYKTHCQKGFDILKQGNFPEAVQTVALQHHERINGDGFPNGLRGEKIHPFAKIVAVADAYDNLTSEREGLIQKTPFDAINHFVSECYSAFDPEVCVPLVTRIKDNLVGSKIFLNDGRKGTIAFYPKDFSSLPIVVTEDGTEVDLNQRKYLSIAQYSG